MTPEKLAEALNSQLLGAWDIYVKFFTVFLTVNITALGVVVTKIRPGKARSVISITFFIQNVIAFVTGIMMARYTGQITEQLARIASELSIFSSLGRWGGIANAIGNGIIGVTWLVIIFIGESAPTSTTLVTSGHGPGVKQQEAEIEADTL
jgi:hypothetical protein